MFGLAAPIAAAAGEDTHEYLGDLAFKVTRERTSSLKEISFDDANNMIVALGGTAFPFLTRSKRTENYRKQVAGVKTIETESHLKLMNELAGKLGWDEARLRGFCNRQIKKDSPTTTEEGNKVVEGLKAMVKRGSNVAVFPVGDRQKPAVSKEPGFRRVA